MPISSLIRQLSAAQLRRDMKRARRSNGLPTDLKAMIVEYRKTSPEYADRLERMIYPKFQIMKFGRR